MYRYNLLIVDDAEIELDGLEYLIKKYKYPFNVIRASRAIEALEILKNNNIDLVITDIRMPEMDGLELVTNIRDSHEDMAIIISSAYRDFSYAKKAMKLNIEDYLVKPIDIKEFQHVINKVLEEINIQQNDCYQRICTLIFQGVYGKNDDLCSALESIGYDANSQYSLIVINNTEHFFDMRSDKMASIMDKCFTSDYFYVNLNEHESLILIPKISTIKKINKQSRQLYERLSKEGQFTFSVSSRFFTIKEINHQFEFLNDIIGNQLYIGKNQYLIQNEYIDPYIEGSSDAKYRIDFICENIQLKNLKIVKKHLDELFNFLKQSNNYSAFFIKYLLCNVVNSFITNYQISKNSSVIVNRIMKYNRLEELHQEIIKILNEADETQQNLLSQKKDAIKDAVNFIHQNYNKDISLQQLADHVFLSPNYLSYLFKLEMNQTITEYIINNRLEKAKYLLKNTPLKIAQVSRQVGYDNVPYFTSLFKKYYGMTPGNSRKGS